MSNPDVSELKRNISHSGLVNFKVVSCKREVILKQASFSAPVYHFVVIILGFLKPIKGILFRQKYQIAKFYKCNIATMATKKLF